MLNVFGVYKGCELMLDSLAVPERAVDECLRAARAPPPEPDLLESLAPFLQAWPYQGLETAAPDTLEPCLVEMKRSTAQLAGQEAPEAPEAGLRRAAEAVAQAMGEEGEPAHAWLKANVDPAVFEFQDSVPEYGGGEYADHDQAEYSEEESDAEEAPGEQAARPGGMHSMTVSTGQLTQEALQWLITGNTAGKGWMGAGHWRYRAETQPGAAEEATGAGVAASKRARNAKPKHVLR